MKSVTGTYLFFFGLILVFVFSYQPKSAEACGICDAISNAIDSISNAFSGGGSSSGSSSGSSGGGGGFCGNGCGSPHTSREAAIAAANARIGSDPEATISSVTQARDGTWSATVDFGGSSSDGSSGGTTPFPIGGSSPRYSLTASSCQIPLGGSTCLSTVRWNFDNALRSGRRSVRQGTNFTFHDMGQFSNENRSSAERVVDFQNNRFAIFSNGSSFTRRNPLARATARVTCAAGTAQNDGGTTRCLCPTGQIANAANTACVPDTVTPVDPGGPGPVPGGPVTPVTPGGGTGGPTSGGPITPTPETITSLTVTLENSIVRSGASATGTVTVISSAGAICVLSPVSVLSGGSNTVSITSGGSQSFIFTTAPLQNQLRVGVTCTPPGGGVPQSGSADISVIPRIIEI